MRPHLPSEIKASLGCKRNLSHKTKTNVGVRIFIPVSNNVLKAICLGPVVDNCKNIKHNTQSLLSRTKIDKLGYCKSLCSRLDTISPVWIALLL